MSRQRWLSPGVAASACALALACGQAPPPRARTLPDDAALRDAEVMELGSSLWNALVSSDAFALLANDVALAELLSPTAQERLRARRPGLRARVGDVIHALPERLAGATYVGICAQDARDEPAGGALGLRRPTWLIERVLIAGTLAGGSRRIALWVAGPFAYDGEAFVALELSDVESPRWEHSDLELGACDVSEGL